jgi:hypothetical protein
MKLQVCSRSDILWNVSKAERSFAARVLNNLTVFWNFFVGGQIYENLNDKRIANVRRDYRRCCIVIYIICRVPSVLLYCLLFKFFVVVACSLFICSILSVLFHNLFLV